jgi:hypothetical protein
VTNEERLSWIADWIEEGNQIEILGIRQGRVMRVRVRLIYDAPRPLDLDKDNLTDALDAAIEATQ